MMRDFYLEQTRSTVHEDWDDSVTKSILEEKLQVTRVSYRIYYSKDNLTRRIFIFRPYCTDTENAIMLGLGFVIANPGDSDNIPESGVES